MICTIVLAAALWLEPKRVYAFTMEPYSCPQTVEIAEVPEGTAQTLAGSHVRFAGSVMRRVMIDSIVIQGNMFAFHVLRSEATRLQQLNLGNDYPPFYRDDWLYALFPPKFTF